MDHIINAKERKYAFMLFLISFTITVAIIVGAVYFDTLIPKNENVLLRQKIGDFEEQIFTQKQFIISLEGVQSLNDSLAKIGVVHPLVEREITAHLSSMNHLQHKEGTLFGQLNADIFNFMYEYTEMNKRLLNLNKELEEIETLKADLHRTKGELEQANRSLDVYRNSSNLGIR